MAEKSKFMNGEVERELQIDITRVLATTPTTQKNVKKILTRIRKVEKDLPEETKKKVKKILIKTR